MKLVFDLEEKKTEVGEGQKAKLLSVNWNHDQREEEVEEKKREVECMNFLQKTKEKKNETSEAR